MTKISVVIIGHNKWDEFTYPLIMSLQEYEPEIDIVIVDNGSEPRYSISDRYRLAMSDNHSVAKALNIGIKASGYQDWYLLLDNDTTCTAPFTDMILKLDNEICYGARLKDWDVFHYLAGYCILLSSRVRGRVGLHDEGFYPWGYTDADYSYRVIEAGFRIEEIELPFDHVLHGSHEYLDDIEAIRERNQNRFLDKHGLKIK